MKIPPQAKQVFKGRIFDVYQWEQEMFDGTFEIFEAVKRPNTIQIIPTRGDKIFISKESQPHRHNYYSLLGGRAEEGEDPLVTAKRELLEESGLVSDDWELFKTYSNFAKIQWDLHFFIARNCKKIAEPRLDAGEKIEILEYDFEKFKEFIENDEHLAKDLALDLLKMEKIGTISAFKEKLFTKSSNP